MKKTALLIALSSAIIGQVFAKQIDLQTAEAVVNNFVESIDEFQESNKNNSLTIAYICSSQENGIIDKNDKAVYYYVFNTGTHGFVIVSGDDNIKPILGYSTSSSFNNQDLPPNFRKWLEGYKYQIRHVISNSIQSSEVIKDEWETLLSGSYSSKKASAGVNPLLTTTWDQSPYYNELCPGGSVSGCVATAMAQIMKFWAYPTQGTGFHSYNEDDYGTLSANFGSTTYQWASMPDNVTSSNNAVATLMYHCGVSVDMDYSPQVSGAWVIKNSPAPQACSEYAYTTYFGYDSTVQGVERENYTTSSWIQLLKTELDAGRPINYAGFGSGGGHAFVCDGYDNNEFFHFNWGWGGYQDGFFSIDALDPNGTGTGGGSGGYNSGHQAVIGIKPPSGTQALDMKLFDFVALSSDTIYYGQAFSVTTNILNNGTNNFSGDYSAAVFDNSNNLIDYVEVKTGLSLSGGSSSNAVTFSTTGLLSMLPGTYFVGIYYRTTGGSWIIVADDGSYTNLVQILVINPNDIELNSAMSVTPSTTLTQGQSASVNLNIVNDGVSTFLGDYSADLYNLDGSWVENIGSYTESVGLISGGTYTAPYLTFSTSSITAAAGTYLLAIQHFPTGGINWELTGSSYYQNPIYVIVQGADLQPDIYESNDIQTTAYNLPVSFSGNNATVLTTGSNSHNGTDYDYYQIDLPSGYDYTITARTHDSYNSGNTQTYTNDVLWSYLLDSTWSDVYDDVMSSNITVIDGGTIYFHVSPYFLGETGTYLLDLQITRAVTSIQEIASSNILELFPNPSQEYINLKFTEDVNRIVRINIFDVTGKQVMNYDNIAMSNDLLTIPIQKLSFGSYIIVVETKNGVLYDKFVKSK